jgi:hypothetical protein
VLLLARMGRWQNGRFKKTARADADPNFRKPLSPQRRSRLRHGRQKLHIKSSTSVLDQTRLQLFDTLPLPARVSADEAQRRSINEVGPVTAAPGFRLAEPDVFAALDELDGFGVWAVQ